MDTLTAPQLYKAGVGPDKVAVEPELVLEDPSRNRNIHLRVTYPEKPGKLPAIIFSHGAWSTNFCYYALSQHWASHGYVVIQANHQDSVAEGVVRRDQSVFDPWVRRSRVLDDRHVLDHIQDLGVSALKDRIDPDRVGVGGHSYGASTTMMLAGMTIYEDDGTTENLGDPRLKAAVVLAGPGRRGGMTEKGGGASDASYATIAIPMIVITGTDDPGRLGEPPEWRIDPFTYARPGDKHLLLIQGADHFFGGVCREDPAYPQVRPEELRTIPEHADYVASTTIAFWDAYLGADKAALQVLATDQIGSLSGGEAKLTAK